MSYFHPTIVSDKLVPTVNFYEDYFDFVPLIEKDGYTLMQQDGNPDDWIAIVDSDHKALPSDFSPIQGLILNIAVDDVTQKFNDLYMEGLDIYKNVGTDIHGRTHFIVYDPNGVLVNVHDAVKPMP